MGQWKTLIWWALTPRQYSLYNFYKARSVSFPTWPWTFLSPLADMKSRANSNNSQSISSCCWEAVSLVFHFFTKTNSVRPFHLRLATVPNPSSLFSFSWFSVWALHSLTRMVIISSSFPCAMLLSSLCYVICLQEHKAFLLWICDSYTRIFERYKRCD